VKLVVDIPAAGAANGWDLWINPRDADTTAGDVHVARRDDDETRAALAAGRRVLLLSEPEQTGALAIRSSFLPVFWSLAWFAEQPARAAFSVIQSILRWPRSPRSSTRSGTGASCWSRPRPSCSTRRRGHIVR
jgi:hypothetical protein